MTYNDIFAKCKTDEGYFGQFRAAGDRTFTLPVIESVPDKYMKAGGNEFLMWSINNYLGLAGNEEIKAAAREALEVWSVSGPMGSRMMSGNTPDHIALEEELADFAQKESSILFNYGYLGVIGTIASLMGPDDVIVMDKLAHASIVDAAISAVSDRRSLRVFRHNDMNSLETTLKRVNENRKGGVFVLTEGVYGMTGDLAKMDEICELKDKYEARLFVDDAHGVGVMGPNGRGTGEYFGVQDKIDIYFGTFAKAFASIGGFSAGNKDVIEWIRYNSRTQVFAKSLPMIYVKSLQKTLELVRNGNDKRAKLFDIAAKLSKGLRDIGFFVGDVKSPIIPVFVPGGDPKIGMYWIQYLRSKGIFTTAVVYPVIPKNFVMFRIIPTAIHDDEDVQKTLDAFKSLRDENKMDLNLDPKDIRKLYGEK